MVGACPPPRGTRGGWCAQGGAGAGEGPRGLDAGGGSASSGSHGVAQEPWGACEPRRVSALWTCRMGREALHTCFWLLEEKGG